MKIFNKSEILNWLIQYTNYECRLYFGRGVALGHLKRLGSSDVWQLEGQNGQHITFELSEVNFVESVEYDSEHIELKDCLGKFEE